MTTPSVNRNVTASSQGTKVITEFDAGKIVSGPSTSPSSSYNSSWDRESRPASANSTFLFRNFRGCKQWNHSGLLLYRHPESVTVSTMLPNKHVVQQKYFGGFWTGFNPPSPLAFPSWLVNKAEIKALERLKAQNIHLGNFLATFGDTLHLVAGALQTIGAGVRRFRRANPEHVWRKVRRYEGSPIPRLRKKVPGNWLALQYGWLPLMSDVEGALNEVFNKISRGAVFRVTGRAESDDLVSSDFSSTNLAGSVCTINTRTTSSCHVSLWYKLANPPLAEVSSLGLINPAEIVWECLPYSFVVDWFTPISSWLAALTADVGYQFVSGSQTRVQRYRYEQGKVVFGTSPVIRAEGNGILLSGTGGYAMTRTCYSSSPVPGLYVKNPFSLRHVLNALALLSQSFGGSSRRWR